VFCEKRLQTIENKGWERGKECEERHKRLQAAENMGFVPQRHGDTEALNKRRHSIPAVFVSAYSKGVTRGVSVSADSKGVRGAGWWRIYLR
jgi:hypothetical protein